MDIDPVILGTNPINGVSHFSSRIARERMAETNDDGVIEVIDAALESGAGGINLSPSLRLYRIFQKMKEARYPRDFNVYLMLPDMERFRSAMLNGGPIRVAKELVHNVGWSVRLAAIASGAISYALSDYGGLIRAYLQIEKERIESVLPEHGKLKCILAHEQVTDLAVALGANELIYNFYESVMDMGFTPGFVTRNLPLFKSSIHKLGLNNRNIAVMAPFNKVGFQMIPSRESSENAAAELRGAGIIGISLFAGGRLSLTEALDYLRSNSILNSVVFGASSVAHAKETSLAFKAVMN